MLFCVFTGCSILSKLCVCGCCETGSEFKLTVGNKVFWGMGAGTAGPFYPGNAGNKLYMFTID